jgi:HNH endonuclease
MSIPTSSVPSGDLHGAVLWSYRHLPLQMNSVASKRTMSRQPKLFTRTDLLKVVRRLPERTRIVSAHFPDVQAKQTWIDWLSDYPQHGDNPRWRQQRDARFIYHRWWNAPVLIWLAEASGVEQARILRAAKIASRRVNSLPLGAAIRKLLPWSLVADHLARLRQPPASKALPVKNVTASISPFEQQVRDVEQIKKRVKDQTTRQALIDARQGQGRFRADVGRRWGNVCAVTGCGISAVLRASHIKPWAICTDQERLNPANGLLLAAHIDALFDQGLVSFADDGAMLISDKISPHTSTSLRLASSAGNPLAHTVSECESND